MPKQYFVRRGEKIGGPLSPDKVRDRVAAGKLQLSDEIAYARSGPWKAIGDIPALANLSATTDDEWTDDPAYDDEYAEDSYGDDAYGADAYEYAALPTPAAKRKRKQGSGERKKADRETDSSSSNRIIVIVAGLGLIAFLSVAGGGVYFLTRPANAVADARDVEKARQDNVGQPKKQKQNIQADKVNVQLFDALYRYTADYTAGQTLIAYQNEMKSVKPQLRSGADREVYALCEEFVSHAEVLPIINDAVLLNQEIQSEVEVLEAMKQRQIRSRDAGNPNLKVVQDLQQEAVDDTQKDIDEYKYVTYVIENDGMVIEANIGLDKINQRLNSKSAKGNYLGLASRYGIPVKESGLVTYVNMRELTAAVRKSIEEARKGIIDKMHQ